MGKRRADLVGYVLFVAGVSALSCGLFMLATGCAVGRTEAGGVVLGVEAGALVETSEQALGSLADAGLAALGIGVPGAGAIALLARKLFRAGTDAAAAKARHEGERAGWDEAVVAGAKA
jgi:hypothetical protein